MTPPGDAPAPRVPLYVQTLIAMGLGVAIGPHLGPHASEFGELGKWVIQLIKVFAAPLLFLTIVSAIIKTPIAGRSGLRLLGWASVNATLALGIGLLLSNVFRPGAHLADLGPVGDPSAYGGKAVTLSGALSGLIPSSILSPFVDGAILSIVLLALLVGFAMRTVMGKHEPVEASATPSLDLSLGVTEKILTWVLALIPVAVFGVVAKSVAQYGFAPLKGLLAYLAVALVGLFAHAAVVYHAELLLLTRVSLRQFWREAKEPVLYSLGANSSLATLPLTLKALDRLGVSKSSSALGACVGTNLNNDGILLYEGMAVLFVAQASGIDLSLAQQLLAASACMVAAMGVAGIPEAGFISLALVLNTVGLPIELLPLLLTVDWIVARARSAINVLSDMMLSLLLDRSAGPQRAPD